jgi:hypothetical protein
MNLLVRVPGRHDVDPTGVARIHLRGRVGAVRDPRTSLRSLAAGCIAGMIQITETI